MEPHPPIDARNSPEAIAQEQPEIEAESVYVLMKKNTRVSRNIRACWFFRHLKKSVSFTPGTSVEGLTEDLTLVSVVPRDPEVRLEPGQTYQVHVGPDTSVTFLSSQYRLSFTLDLSPSLMSVDIHSGHCVYDGVFQSLDRCLRGLVKPLLIPGSNIWYSPELYISVICQTPVVCSSTNQVLVQGVKVDHHNIDHYLKHIHSELMHFEAALSSSFANLLKLFRRKESFFLDEDEGEAAAHPFNLSEHLGSPEAGFTNMLRYGILSLQLLPENSSSGIIIITDGIVGLPNSYLMELLLNQLRNNTIMCSFIKVGSPSGLYRKLSHVPHIELMQAIATATFGAYLGAGPDVSQENGANLYQRAMLFWSFQRGLEGFKYDLTHYSDEDLPGSISWIRKMLHRHPITGESFGIENLRKERDKRRVVAGLHSVLSVRLREGYTIKSVCFKKDHSEIHVKLHFPWRDYGKIEYAAWATWPLDNANAVTNIEVTVEGSYDLLHEMLCKPNGEVKSGLRVNNIKTLWTILERISSTDQMLEHLQTFSSQPVYYQTPESIRSGVPLFYMQQDGPSINMQLKASTMDQFAAFWKAVIQLDTNNWQKWLHSHRIGLVLEHDRQFPKCFQVPNASSRFTSIQCRQAQASLSLLLREWSTFVLAENHSYIKFLQQEPDKPPRFFCVLRLTSKAPNMIIRLGFLGGTPASLRLEELEILREKINNLSFPQRGTQKEEEFNTSRRSSNLSSGEPEEKKRPHKSPLNREGSEIACCVLLRKPVEKILVVYESKPRDMTVIKEPVRETPNRTQIDPMRSVFRTLTHYLQHQRWVWNIQANSKSAVSMASISRMLATITKLRLQEGFHFAVSGAGVTNLVLEVDMKESNDCSEEDDSFMHSCVVQYIIFPPHTKTIDDSLSEDDQEETETTEADGEVQIVTECWVEPQYGVCCNNSPERQHFNGLTYLDIAKVFYPWDYEVVSSLTTFEHLVYLCENSAIPSPDVAASRQSSPPSTPGHHFSGKNEESIRSAPTVNFISFPFDLQSILPRSQQAEMLFSTFVIGNNNTVSQDVVLDPKEPNELLMSLFFDKLKESHSNEILVSADDCFRFVQHILQRPRDHKTNPIPFAYRPNQSQTRGRFAFEQGQFSETDHETTDASTTSAKKSTDPGHRRSGEHTAPGSGKKDNDTPRSAAGDSTPKNSHGKFHHTPQSAQSVESGQIGMNGRSRGLNDGHANKFKRSESVHCPMWKCYIKQDVTEHLLLTFIPASFDDLLLLYPSPADTSPTEETSGDTNEDFKLPDKIIVNEDKEGKTEGGSEVKNTLVKDEATSTTSHNKRSKSQVQSETQATDTASKNADSNRSSTTPIRESRQEQVQQWVNTSTHSMKPIVSGPLLLPVYVYSCQLKNVTNSLIDRWSFNLPSDIFEDMSFKTDPTSDQRSPHSPRSQLQSFDLHTDDQDDRDSWRSSLDRRSTDSNSYRLESFKEHCKLLTEMFFNSFVTGVFLSLQHSYFVDSVDVDSVINNICEESHPLETDMTTYLLASCSHMQQLVRKGQLKEKCSEDRGRGGHVYPKQLTVRFQDIDLQKEDEAPKIPEALQLPEVAIEITDDEWASLSPDQCQQLKDHHLLTAAVRAKFLEAIGQCLKPVSTLPDFYFYCPNIIHSGDGLDHDNSDEHLGAEDIQEETVEEEEDVVMSHNGEAGEMSVGTSMESNHDDSSLGSFEGNMSTESVDSDPMPLFVHFTCTVKQKSDMQHTSLRTVPLCLGEITKGLSEPFLFLDFADFKVTFDINCLTLLVDNYQPKPRKVSYMRMLSNASQLSTGAKDEVEENASTASSAVKPMGDPVSHLSKLQHSAIYGFKDEIESLMQEEVISALRHISPVSADTLLFVADYIRTTIHCQSKTAMYQCIKLQFVYGPDQSLNMFIEEFERQHLPGYRLTKEGDYYFLIVNKAEAHHLRYSQQLKCAFTHFEMVTRQEEEAEERDKLAICKEERSFSLPCIFSDPSDQLIHPEASQSVMNTGEDTTSSEAGGSKLRPRSCSDTKSLKRPRSALARGNTDVKGVVSLPNANNCETMKIIESLRMKENTETDASLKKSKSFAGLQGTQVRSPGTVASSSRSRHCSAPSGHVSIASRPSTMPQSPSVISSRESTNDDGFDGDVSDMELDETASMSDISSCYPELPEFWLLMQVHVDHIEVFFHSREPIDCESPANTQHQALYSAAINNIHNVCRKVNQALLLKELNKTKVCNSLLVPEADEDVNWTSSRRTLSGRSVPDGYEQDEEDDSEESPQGYLEAALNLSPGFFACDIVWQYRFTIHPRLKHGAQRGAPPMGVLVLRKVLQNFLVSNRKNMFVIEELSSRNVFYLRLKELQVDRESVAVDFDLEASLSDSNHFTQYRQVSRADSDTVSMTSSLGRQSSRVDDVVELTVHGVEDVGDEIKVDLMKMLQNKLDDALLDNICVMLSRNPQCRLKPDDIFFIQKPREEPVETLQLTIPGHCSMYLVAMMYYLRQNLLQFLHTPNYVDNNPACQFQDVQDGIWTAIPSDKVYLYVRPQPGGGKGIGCISTSLVDGQGREVKLLNCPCPTKNNMPAISDPGEFDKFVQTTVHEKSTSSRPGPTALIQFRIWECGNCDLKILCERLISSVRHTLCDIIMEYYMLTTPICSVPKNLVDIYAQPVSSLPASPTKQPSDCPEKRHSALTRKFSVDPPKSVTPMSALTAAMDWHGSGTGLFSSTGAGKFLDFTKAPPPASDQLSLPRTPGAVPSVPMYARKNSSSDVLGLMTKYESGDKGNLHPVFCSLIVPWLSFCHSIGVQSVTKTKLEFQSRFSVDYVVKELMNSIPSVCNDTILKTFKVIKTCTPDETEYGIQFTPCRTTSKDFQISKVTASGGKVRMLAIGRNMDQWQNTVQDHQDNMPCFTAPVLRSYRGTQKFLPQVATEFDPSKSLEQSSLRCADKDFVPRQKLLIFQCQGKEMTLLMYNWSTDLVNTVEKIATRLVQWNNARTHLLGSIIGQKMGIFHHFAFSDLQYSPSQNPFTQSSAEIDTLIRHHAPSRDYQRRNSSMSSKEKERSYSRAMKRIVPFDHTYKNLPPPKLLERLMCNVSSDPVSRHGVQALEFRQHSRQDKQAPQPQQHQQQTTSGTQLRSEEKVPVTSINDPVFQHGLHLNETQKFCVAEEERTKLYQLYLGWSQANWKNKANPPIMEDYLMQLKRAGRLFHYCATPLVFSASWRQNVVQKTTGKGDKSHTFGNASTSHGNSNANTTPSLAAAAALASVSVATTPATPDRSQKTRSRHSSGASNISLKGRITEETSRKGSEAGLGGGVKTRTEPEEEEQWHIELRQRFIKEYKQYLVSELGFIKLNVQPSLNKKGSTLSSQGLSESGDNKIVTINLQKTLTGGIIVMELSFRQEFFCVKMFAIDCSQLRVIVNQQIHLIFVDECDKYKDLIHVHSFAHDFHLRCVQRYLSKQEDSVFPAGFDLDSFLTDFKQIYSYPPSFSRNCLQLDFIRLPDLPFPGNMLYDYMLKQMGQQEMNVFRMVCYSSGKEMGDKFALVKHDKLQLPGMIRDTEDEQNQSSEVYDAGLVIINNSAKSSQVDDSMKLELKYFTVLTRERDCYPIRTLEKAFGEFRGTVAAAAGGRKRSLESVDSSELAEQEDNEPSKPVAVRQHIGMRKEHVNYRGYSNVQQLSLFSSLVGQSERGKENILEMVEMSKIKCRRDYLWQRLLFSHSEIEEGRKRRSETDESGESMRNPLTSVEFCELLETVTKISLSEFDSQLTALFTMPVGWYRSLFPVLISKYPDAHRSFSSPDRKTQYMVVLNANNLDMFSMLSLNGHTEQTDMCVVMKEPIHGDIRHTPHTPNLSLYSLQTHVEDFVNVCCYHVWASML